MGAGPLGWQVVDIGRFSLVSGAGGCSRLRDAEHIPFQPSDRHRFCEPGGGLLGFLARQAVHDSCIPGMLVLEKAQQLCPRVVLETDAGADIGAIETRHEPGRGFQVQPLQDFAPGALVGGGGKGDAGHVREQRVQQVELQVVGAKIMAPLGYAMGLVDGEQGDD